MRRRWWRLPTILLASTISAGCNGDDDDDKPELKTSLPLDQVPAAVMKRAHEQAPNLTFFAAYKGTYQGKPAIELKGRTKSGQIKELEIAPDGTFLGTE